MHAHVAKILCNNTCAHYNIRCICIYVDCMHIIIRLFVKLTFIIVGFVEAEFVQELGGASMVQHGTYTEAPAVIDSTTIRS